MVSSSIVLTLRKSFSSITVQRRKPELIVPAKPTPHEFKCLSDIDDRKGNRKLLVECTGQGVIFVEADADVSLNQLGGDDLKPPFPYLEQLLYAPADSEDILSCPLMCCTSGSVTRLTCGGFIFGVSHNHTICDAQGLHQFKIALEVRVVIAFNARGKFRRNCSRSCLSVYSFGVGKTLTQCSRTSTSLICSSRVISSGKSTFPCLVDDMVQYSFFFGPKELASLRQHVPHHLQRCATFDAIGYDPKEEVRVVIAFNARGKFRAPLPIGFYGNAIADPVAVSTAEELIENPLSTGIELVKKAMNEVNEEYIRSTADLMATKGRPTISTERTYFVSDLRRVLNGDEVDFGCGELVQVYSGTAIPIPTLTSWMSSVYISYRKSKGGSGILVPVSLPRLAMKKFVIDMESAYTP
ncbi:hypothetical protein MKX03_019735 [Papaver bracteatum]|nr:hypothetical protein MKX03_019735 [Papaver bracteatum]